MGTFTVGRRKAKISTSTPRQAASPLEQAIANREEGARAWLRQLPPQPTPTTTRHLDNLTNEEMEEEELLDNTDSTSY